jgi:predicted Rossmann fold flavoprotein
MKGSSSVYCCMLKSNNTIVIIGGGAAGIIAAWRAASLGASVILLEKNSKPGIKILISGGGKCNITNASNIRMMLKQFRRNESRFLRFAFHEFTNEALLELLHAEGVETYARDNGKVFPVSHDAEDVVRALQSMMDRSGAVLRLQSPVKEIFANPDGTFNVQTNKEIIRAHAVIIAAGGMSYQKTGTTGDGFRWLKNLGHTIIPIRPALAPIHLTPVPPSSWQGTPIREGTLKAIASGQVVSEWNGDVLITHFGLSGPAALEVSRDAFTAMEAGKTVEMVVDFFPEFTQEQMDERLISECEANPSRTILTLTEQLVPQKLAEYLLVTCNIPFATKLNQMPKSQRRTLAAALKQCSLGTVSEIPLDRGEVTAGGAALDEVHETTMESKTKPGLFLCGEILDIAGPVGGYNLQAAFSTGFVAGSAAAEHVKKIISQ